MNYIIQDSGMFVVAELARNIFTSLIKICLLPFWIKAGIIERPKGVYCPRDLVAFNHHICQNKKFNWTVCLGLFQPKSLHLIPEYVWLLWGSAFPLTVSMFFPIFSHCTFRYKDIIIRYKILVLVRIVLRSYLLRSFFYSLEKRFKYPNFFRSASYISLWILNTASSFALLTFFLVLSPDRFSFNGMCFWVVCVSLVQWD